MQRALIIGITYQGDKILDGCQNDVSLIVTRLKKNGLRDADIIVASDNPSEHLRHRSFIPTRTNIINMFKDLFRPGAERLYFHFSGHGTIQFDPTGKESSGYDDCVVPVDWETTSMITDDELRHVIDLHRLHTQSLFMTFDCCHSGTIMDLPYNFSTHMTGQTAKVVTEHQYRMTPGNCIVISACRDNEVSEDTGKRVARGALTTIIDTWMLHFNKKSVTAREFMEYICQHMLSLGFNQHPCLSFGRPFNIDTPFHVDSIKSNIGLREIYPFKSKGPKSNCICRY